jgi:hypothetical protein
MAPFAINSSGAGTNTIYTGYGAQSPAQTWRSRRGTTALMRVC